MTVAQLIEKLQTMPQHLPVCLSDWQEMYYRPSEKQAEIITLQKDSEYAAAGSLSQYDTTKGDFVQLGD